MSADVVHVWGQPSPIGTLAVAAGATGLRCIDLRGDVDAVAAELLANGDDVDVSSFPTPHRVARQLAEYFAGERTSFDLAVDFSAVRGFHRRVLEVLERDVRHGEVVSYGELAALAGRPGAARAVGQAMHRNPVPIVVPCHRVVAASGLGGYGAGVAAKRWLLGHEGVLTDVVAS